jgi:ribosome biogenesis GTPase
MANNDTRTGRVLRSYGNRYIVQTSDGTYDCYLRGKFRLSTSKQTAPVAVGDRVEITLEQPPYGVIEDIEERQTKISRPDVHNPEIEQVIVANVDQLVVISAVKRPRFKRGAIDRFLLAAERNGLSACICLNKVDLATDTRHQEVVEIYRKAGYQAVVCSAMTGEGLDQFKDALQFRTSILAGHSGVGKSSLINAIQPGLSIATSEISEATGKGVHTTTSVELHPLDIGGYVADTPGLREIGLWDIKPEDLAELYPEIRARAGQCKFRNCAHIGEPECAIKQAVDEKNIASERYETYVRIYQSLREA